MIIVIIFRQNYIPTIAQKQNLAELYLCQGGTLVYVSVYVHYIHYGCMFVYWVVFCVLVCIHRFAIPTHMLSSLGAEAANHIRSEEISSCVHYVIQARTTKSLPVVRTYSQCVLFIYIHLKQRLYYPASSESYRGRMLILYLKAEYTYLC